MILKHLFRSRVLFVVAIGMLCLVSACKKNSTGPVTPSIDPNFVGVWYSSADTLGFEILSDGSSKTLVVDTAGKLQYAPANATTATGLSLTITQAQSGNLTALVRYKIPGFIDTTVNIPGTYAFSNSNNTLSITFPNLLTVGQPSTIVFLRSGIGIVVRTRSVAATLPRRSKD